MSRPKLSVGRAARFGLAAALAVAGVGLAATGSTAAASYTVSPSTGPGTTVNTVLAVSGTGFKNASGVNQVHSAAAGVQFQTATACATTEGTPDGSTVINASSKIVSSATRLIVKTPSLPLGASNAAKLYNLCVYKDANTLLGSTKYTVYPRPTVTDVSPTAGSVAGGDMVTITGTGFTSKTTVKFGTVAGIGVKMVSATEVTAIVPAQGAGDKEVYVATEGGTDTNTNTYSYTNAIEASPSTGVAAGGTTLTITGVGFDDLDFTADANVLFVRGAYDPVDDGLGDKTNGEVGYCENIVVVTDKELICDTPDGSAGDGSDDVLVDGAYTVTVVSDDQLDADLSEGFQTVVSSGATFTAADF